MNKSHESVYYFKDRHVFLNTTKRNNVHVSRILLSGTNATFCCFFILPTFNLQSCAFWWTVQCSWPVSHASQHMLMSSLFPFSNTRALCTPYLGSVSVPAQVLREAVKADVVGLTLRPRWAESQAVIVLLHLLHLRSNTEMALRTTLDLICNFTLWNKRRDRKRDIWDSGYSKATRTHHGCEGDKFSQEAAR